MNRRFWGGAIIISLLITAGAGYYVFTQIQNKEIVSMVTAETTPVAPAAKDAGPMAHPGDMTASTTTVVVATITAPIAGNQKRNILFSIARPNAKSVMIVGDFNDWKADSMVKKDRKWQRVVPLAPGTYKYMFVVDKKQVRDPSNKAVEDGKSVITVKPADAGK